MVPEKWRAATGLMAAAAAAASLLTAGPAQAEEAVPPPAAGQLRVISWNICGEAGGTRGDVNSPGYCPKRNEPALKMKAVAALATKQQADVVMLQEACGSRDKSPVEDPGQTHEEVLEAELPGWTIVHAVGDRGKDGTGAVQTSCRGTALAGHLGVLIAVKGAVPDTVVQSFETAPATLTATDFTSVPHAVTPTSGEITALSGRIQPALCVRKEGWPDKICTTHLLAGKETEAGKRTPESVVRGMQAQAIRSKLGAEFGAGLILGGDLNARETDLSLAPLAGSLARYTNDEFTHMGWEKPTAVAGPGKAAPHRYDHVLTGKRNHFTSIEVDHSLMDLTDPYSVPVEPAGVFSDHAPVITTVRRVPGDLDGDGLPDLLAVDDAKGEMRLHPGNGHGGLGASVLVGTKGWSGASVTHRGDWTGDGAEDIVARVQGELRLFPNLGDGRIYGHTVLATGLPDTAKIVGVGDATGDGFPDLVAQYGDALYRYDGVPAVPGTPVSVKPPVNLGTGGWDVMTLTAPGDADGDGRVDLLARNTTDGNVWLYHGRDGGSFGSTGTRTPFGHGYTRVDRPRIAAGADANGDGTADMWATTKEGRLLFYPGGTDALGNPVDQTSASPSVEVAAGGWSGTGSLG
ncbi:FG-GAP-like repeat-containing protein [Streptomyces sp. NPDC059957]|uniref:FG-GAP-like repeat-containing protein n=1 Tax=unclassified Streptomyces TaxID=2593676 RepID=UPI0036621E88